MDREKAIEEIQKINSSQANSINELANLTDKELSARLTQILTFRRMKGLTETPPYKTCDKCSYDILDDEGDIMEHECITYSQNLELMTKAIDMKNYKVEDWLNNFADYVQDSNIELYKQAKDFADGVKAKDINDLAIKKILKAELFDITEDRYMSTYGFVTKNKLEILANYVLGDGTENSWEAEDDVEQIQKLCDAVEDNKYIVSSIHGLKYDDDIEVRIDNSYFEHNDIKKLIFEVEQGMEDSWTAIQKIKEIIS